MNEETWIFASTIIKIFEQEDISAHEAMYEAQDYILKKMAEHAEKEHPKDCECIFCKGGPSN